MLSERGFSSATDTAAMLLQEYHSVMQAWRRRRGIFKEVWCVWHMEAPNGVTCLMFQVSSRQTAQTPQLPCDPPYVSLSVAA